MKVVLYYPNATWRARVGDLVPLEDKSFNWFLCSKRYKDPASGYYIAEISKTTKFYDETTGATLVPSPDLAEPAKLVIVDDPENKGLSEKICNEDFLKKHGYQGITKTKTCRSKTERECDEDFLCKTAVFIFFPGVLVLSAKEKVCPIVDYAKRNYKIIKKVNPEFPTPQEIDGALEEYKCSTVCRVLYQDISKFFAQNQKRKKLG